MKKQTDFSFFQPNADLAPLSAALSEIPPASRFTVSSSAILSFAQLGLGYDLAGLRRGLEAVIRNERAASSPEPIELNSLTLLAFTLAAAPSLTAEWSEVLLSRLQVFEDEPGDTFSFNDGQYRVCISVRENVIEEVSRLSKRARSMRRG